MPPFPRYTTYKPGELEEKLREMAPGREPPLNLSAASFPPRPGKLLKEHACPVPYPDGREGTCRYERKGPAAHVFRFVCEDGSALASEWHTRPLQNTVEAIEAKARELAPVAYATAVERERREYFCRASESPTRPKRPELFQMSAARARELAGKYALCLPVGEALVPVCAAFDTLLAANQAWRDKGDGRLVVACCNRLDRCWQLPRFNPLYGEFDPRPAPQQRPGEPAGGNC